MGEIEGDAADTVIRRRASGEPLQDAAQVSAAPQPHGDEPPGDDTVIRLVEPFLPSRSRAADRPVLLLDSLLPKRPGAGPDGDGTGESHPLGEQADFALRVPGLEHPVLLDLPVVIGRRPGASRVPEVPAPRRIVVPPERQGVSGRHARIEQLGESVVVTDLGSSNGTVVHLPTGPQLRLRPGESCVVLPDSIIALGDEIDIVVMAVDRPQSSRRTT
ncbi:FHA domain-containing protein [Microcella alkalica]|uniref:FHA domain-containing protein n=1 Tax=Microcella alkalica TaxID=355930 RepID=A0A839E5J1_9MICO|nr:FHA domain-containing protein [Microcella alkalica]MBA8846787.1 hypothetical protein [Microcella alkalica]